MDHLRELYGRLVDTGYGDEEFRNEFLEYINELEELKDQATPEDEVSEGKL